MDAPLATLAQAASEEPSSALSRLGFDFLAATILAITAVLGACAPLYLVRRDRLKGGSGRSVALVLGNMFSAGVMVSAGFCHLLGEAVRIMPAMEFPVAPFLCGCGFLLTLCADTAATMLSRIGGGGNAAVSDGMEIVLGVDLAERGTLAELTGVRTTHPRTPNRNIRDTSQERRDESVPLRGGSAGGSHQAMHTSSPRAINKGSPGNNNGRLSRAASDASIGAQGGATRWNSQAVMSFETDLDIAAEAAGAVAGGGGGGAGGSINGNHGSLSSLHERHGGLGDLHHSDDIHLGGHCHAPPQLQHQTSHGRVSFITAVLMGVALCFHSLLEGAAMGAQETISNSLHIFIAIVSHKGLAAYALGSSIVESSVGIDRFWSVVLPFTFASPVGIFIGYVISDLARGAGAAGLSALASGTFLYVAFMEVIPKELTDTRLIGSKLGALLLGFTLMSILAIWA